MLDLGGVIAKFMQNPKNEIQRGSIPRLQEKSRRSILGLMGVVEMKNGRLVVIDCVTVEMTLSKDLSLRQMILQLCP